MAAAGCANQQGGFVVSERRQYPGFLAGCEFLLDGQYLRGSLVPPDFTFRFQQIEEPSAGPGLLERSGVFAVAGKECIKCLERPVALIKRGGARGEPERSAATNPVAQFLRCGTGQVWAGEIADGVVVQQAIGDLLFGDDVHRDLGVR